MRDRAHDYADDRLAELEKKIQREYQRAVRETQEKLYDYLRRFEIKDEKWRQMVADGKRTETQYKQWRLGQIAVGKRWEAMRDTLARDYHDANVIARSMLEKERAGIYAESVNFGTFEIEMGAKIDTSFALYDADAVSRIIRDSPELLPPPGSQMQQSFEWFEQYKAGEKISFASKKQENRFRREKAGYDNLIAANKDIRWQSGQIQSVITQAILQGESIPNIAKRIAQTMGETNHASTIRYARTAITAAENAGKVDAYRRAEEMGVDAVQEWRAVLDMRTRHEHREADGQRRPIGEPFEVGGEELMFPGDPSASGHLIWNCRCSLRAIVKGLEPMARKYRSLDGIEGMTYEEWKASKVEKPHRITKQEEIADLMRRRYINDDYRSKKKKGG